ncbi:AmpG family muropeptide MFS transporter [Desulforhopalus sp. 52FAK]
MSHDKKEVGSWQQTVKAWLHPKAIAMLFLGFSAGLPILLIFSSLSVWLREAGVDRSAVTYFSWAALGYSFKFLWAPLIDLLPVPVLSRLLGRRRAWMLVAQFGVIGAICSMALVDPIEQTALTIIALSAVCLGFSSATQDIVIDAYRIECADTSLQAMLAAMYISGYRIGMVVAGAGSLFLATFFGSTKEVYLYSAWQSTYLTMACVMLLGVITTLIIDEPTVPKERAYKDYAASDYGRIILMFFISLSCFIVTFVVLGSQLVRLQQYGDDIFLLSGPTGEFLLGLLRFMFSLIIAFISGYVLVKIGLVNRQMAYNSYVAPVVDFFERYGGRTAILFLVLIGCYRFSDIVLGVVSNVFYVDLGFSKNVIGGITKTFGVGMTLVGGFVGGLLTMRYNVQFVLFLGGVLAAGTNLLFMLLAKTGADVTMLTAVIAADNLSAGIATTAFIAFLSSLTHISFTAMQYAIFSSLMTLFPKLIGGYSGSMVTSIGYENFFLATAVMGVPSLVLIWLVRKEIT